MPEPNEAVIEKVNEGTATLTLNRPEKFNTLSFAVLERLTEAAERLSAKPDVRVLVLTGTGKAFCAGHDLKEMGRGMEGDGEASLRALFDLCSRFMLQLQALPVPVIAKVDGIATAAGCQLVAACDLALCSTRSRFAVSGVKYGLFCSTPMVALSRAVPAKPALEMLFTGDFVDAGEALRLNLVNRVVPPEDLDNATAELCGRLIDKPKDVLALGKAAYYRQREMATAEAYRFTSDVIVGNALGPDFAEGLRAFTEKRSPAWQKPG